jgi:hypothetical protein
MQNDTPVKPDHDSKFMVGVFINFDGLGALLLSILTFIFAGVGDSALSYPSEDVNSVIAKKQQTLNIIGFVIIFLLVYWVICNISLVMWSKGKRSWNFVIAGLSILHILGFGILMMVSRQDFATMCFCVSLGWNLILLPKVLPEKKKTTNPDKTAIS